LLSKTLLKRSRTAFAHLVRTQLERRAVDFEELGRFERDHGGVSLAVVRMEKGHFANHLARPEAADDAPA